MQTILMRACAKPHFGRNRVSGAAQADKVVGQAPPGEERFFLHNWREEKNPE